MRQAFTLIELLAVTVLIGIVASLAALTLRSHIDNIQLQRAVDRLSEADRIARQVALAKPAGRTYLELLPKEFLVQPSGRRIVLPSSVTAKRINLNSGRSISKRRLSYSDSGQSETYMLEFRTAKLRRWVAVLGLSGQVILLDSPEQARQLVGGGT